MPAGEPADKLDTVIGQSVVALFRQLQPEVLTVLRSENLQLEVTFPITYGGLWDYPYPEAQSLVKQLRDTFGASKLIWGTDMPNVERFCTYRQSLDYIRRYCTFLTADEKDRILGGNVADLLRIPSREQAKIRAA